MNIKTLTKAELKSGLTTTPSELADKMLSSLPEDVFISATTTFLDPCFGSGTFLIKLVEKLESYGHSVDNIQGRITGIELSTMMFNKTARRLKNYNLNLIKADALSYNIANMKADVLIANPPYNDSATSHEHTNFRGGNSNLGRDFFRFCLTAYTKHAVILAPISNRLYSSGMKALAVSNGLYEVSNVTDSFKGSVSSAFSAIGCFTFDKTKTRTLNDCTVNTIPTNNLGDRVRVSTSNVRGGWCRENLGHVGQYKIFVTACDVRYTDDPSVVETMSDRTRGSWRIVMTGVSSKTTIGPMQIAAPEDSISYSGHCILVDSREQGEALIEYLNTDYVLDIIRRTRLTTTNSAKSFSCIPAPNFLV